MSDIAEKVVRARKHHRCSGDWAHDRMIRPGELYTRSVCFPSHIANGGTRPFVGAFCSQCKPIASGVRAEGGEAE